MPGSRIVAEYAHSGVMRRADEIVQDLSLTLPGPDCELLEIWMQPLSATLYIEMSPGIGKEGPKPKTIGSLESSYHALLVKNPTRAYEEFLQAVDNYNFDYPSLAVGKGRLLKMGRPKERVAAGHPWRASSEESGVRE